MSAICDISLSEEKGQGTLKCLDESRGLHIDFLRLVQFLAQVLGLHYVEFGDERINWLTLFIDITSVLKLSSQVQLLLNLVLVLKNSVNPTLIAIKFNGASVNQSVD